MRRRSLLLALLVAAGGRASAGIPAEEDDCLACHGSDPAASMVLGSGEKLSIYVDSKVFGSSVHGEMLRCGDCHSEKTGYPHDSKPFSHCHAPVYQTYSASVHGKAAEEGNPDVPVCTDCHRAHDILDPRDGSLALRTPEICGRCHVNGKLMQ